MSPLVSVIVITYNSAYALETLDSIKKQDYDNIELIITDDCSTDDSFDRIEEWTRQNRKCFKRLRLLRGRKNKGPTINCMRGIKMSSADYIKIIAGDDTLRENAISTYMDYMKGHTYDIIFSKSECFGNSALIKKSRLDQRLKRIDRVLETENQEIIRSFLIEHMALPTPTQFFTRSLYQKVGGFDKRLPFWEDGPFFYKLLANEVPIGFVSECLVDERASETSLSNSVSDSKVKEGKLSYAGYMHLKDMIKCFFLIKIKVYVKCKRYDLMWNEMKGLYPQIMSLIKYHKEKETKRS